MATNINYKIIWSCSVSETFANPPNEGGLSVSGRREFFDLCEKIQKKSLRYFKEGEERIVPGTTIGIVAKRHRDAITLQRIDFFLR